MVCAGVTEYSCGDTHNHICSPAELALGVRCIEGVFRWV